MDFSIKISKGTKYWPSKSNGIYGSESIQNSKSIYGSRSIDNSESIYGSSSIYDNGSNIYTAKDTCNSDNRSRSSNQNYQTTTDRRTSITTNDADRTVVRTSQPFLELSSNFPRFLQPGPASTSSESDSGRGDCQSVRKNR